MKPINLIPSARRSANERRLALRRWTVAVTVYACLLLIGCGTLRLVGLSQRANVREVRHQLRLLARTNDRTQRTLQSLSSQLADAQRTLDANLAVVDKPDWSLLLLLLARTLEEEVVLRECQLLPALPEAQPVTGPNQPAVHLASDSAADGPTNGQRYTLALSGLGRTQSEVSRFVIRLEHTGLFDQVKLVKTSREPFLRDNAVAFRLECALSERRSAP